MEWGFIYAIGAAVTWGMVYTLDAMVLKSTSPLVLFFIHYGSGALLMLPLIAYFEPGGLKSVTLAVQSNPLLITATTLLAFIAGYAILAAIKGLDAPTASIIEISYPFFVVIFSILIFRSVPNAAFFLGALLLFAGSYVIIRWA